MEHNIIIKRLRLAADSIEGEYTHDGDIEKWPEMMRAAAARIEELEDELKSANRLVEDYAMDVAALRRAR